MITVYLGCFLGIMRHHPNIKLFDFTSSSGPELNQIKRGTFVSLTLDDDEITPCVFSSLFGK